MKSTQELVVRISKVLVVLYVSACGSQAQSPNSATALRAKPKKFHHGHALDANCSSCGVLPSAVIFEEKAYTDEELTFSCPVIEIDECCIFKAASEEAAFAGLKWYVNLTDDFDARPIVATPSVGVFKNGFVTTFSNGALDGFCARMDGSTLMLRQKMSARGR